MKRLFICMSTRMEYVIRSGLKRNSHTYIRNYEMRILLPGGLTPCNESYYIYFNSDWCSRNDKWLLITHFFIILYIVRCYVLMKQGLLRIIVIIMRAVSHLQQFCNYLLPFFSCSTLPFVNSRKGCRSSNPFLVSLFFHVNNGN